MDRLAVVLLSDMRNPIKVEMAMRFAMVANSDGGLASVRFFFFGPGVQVPAQVRENEQLHGLLTQLLESGISAVACAFNARQLAQERQLNEAGIQSYSIGSEVVRLVKEGFQIMTF